MKEGAYPNNWFFKNSKANYQANAFPGIDFFQSFL